MKLSRFIILMLLLSTASLSLATYAANENVDPNATVVKLRKSCKEGIETAPITLNNCFEAFATISGNSLSGLQAWIDNRTTPLVVEIGPGTFEGFGCMRQDISLKGSGPDQTTLLSGSGYAYAIIGVGPNCSNFNVQDLTVKGIGLYPAIGWVGGGSSRWTNVTADGASLPAWTDLSCSTIVSNDLRPVHRWFASRLRGMARTHIAICSENWFYGSEIMATAGASPSTIAAFMVNASYSGPATSANPEIHVQGSVIRALATTGVAYLTPGKGSGTGQGIMAVAAGKNADVHIHGTSVEVIGNNKTNDIAALASWEHGKIHANGAAYNLVASCSTAKTPVCGKTQRINKDSTSDPVDIRAPYLWEPNKTPPVIAGSTTNVPRSILVSLDGSDVAIETDCAAGGCGTVSNEPHVLIFRATCTGTNGPWWDSTRRPNACR